jgi:hypothetical protein
MTRKKVQVFFSLVCLWGSFASAGTGQLFNVVARCSNSILTINTTTPNWRYPSAGIKINNQLYQLFAPNPGCVPSNNGYCLFSVSDTSPQEITISSSLLLHAVNQLKSIEPLSITLCLDGAGETSSCETYQFSQDNQVSTVCLR